MSKAIFNFLTCVVTKFTQRNKGKVKYYGNLPKDENTIKYIFDYVKENNIEKVKKLLANGVDVNVKNSYGQTPLFCVANSLDMTKVLINYGADINIKDDEGNTPLHWMIRSGYHATAEFLMENGVDVNIKDNTGRTPIFTVYGSMRCLLVKYGAYVNIKDNKGLTPLYDFVYSLRLIPSRHRIRIPDIFLNDKTCTIVNVKDEYGWASLHYAASYGNMSMVKTLIEYGATVDDKTFDHGMTPLDLAISYSHTEVIDLLQKL